MALLHHGDGLHELQAPRQGLAKLIATIPSFRRDLAKLGQDSGQTACIDFLHLRFECIYISSLHLADNIIKVDISVYTEKVVRLRRALWR